MSADEQQEANGAKFSLENILGADHEAIEHPGLPKSTPAEGWDEEEASDKPVAEGFCIECEDQPAQVLCETCSDNYCEVCFASQHRKGSRKRHAVKPLSEQPGKKAKLAHNAEASSSSGVNGHAMDVEEDEEDEEAEEWHGFTPEENKQSVEPMSAAPAPGASVGEWFVERAKSIPVRLTFDERKYLRLLEAALNVSEYTDKVDTIGFGLSKAKRIVHQIRELCAIMSGLVLAADYKRGQELFTDRDFQANADFYQQIFELGRRHKIMNPDKMRSTYGKLIYLLQDSQTPEVKDLLNFSCVRPIKTVYSVLEAHDIVDLLRDDLVSIATKEIYSEGRSRREVQKDIKSKERAIETLVSRYERKGLSQEAIRQCLYSIGDNHAFLRANRDPCDKMIAFLQEYYHPTQAKDSKSSLAIRSGKGGARLSHDHSKQYAYVMQSLTLWREILHDMFHLWSLAEQDLLSENITYRLRDTGQGLNRVQAAPKTSRMMHSILHKAQKRVGSWVGSSAIHMGDHNVPNALLFIDKYTQIYRILLPICNTLQQVPILAEKPALRAYFDSEFGSPEGVIREILGDFFRHGFDGSGADNFFDAGSCIDGRLTSAWNWCASLEKKRYFPVFLLSACDEILITTLLKQRDEGNQTDNAQWKGDAWTATANALAGTELNSGGCRKTASACNSRWNALKRSYLAVKSLRDLSGFGWDDDRKLVIASDAIWELYLEAHPDAKEWRTKPFLLYDDMSSLVDGAVATGETSFQPGLQTPSPLPSPTPPLDFTIDPQLQFSQDDLEPSSPVSASSSQSSSSLGDASLGRLVALLHNATRRLNEGHERKPSTGHAMLAISGSLEKVADALLHTPGGPTETERKTKATKLILAIPAAKLDGPLKIQVVQLFRADVNYADQFLALADDMDFAIEYILAELTDIKAAA
ncbi:hypothetical protein HGRIS_010200 [Hohenbuehelia grisea]|uniref:B box-type domain-containing protein n=1 Tax=Hohenbuehelia grisea TaxID=104357 RepID=A0ABR3J3K8_9AGAR